MRYFARRRLKNACLAVAITGLLSWIVVRQTNALGWSSHTSGYALLSAVVFLTLYNLRKKINVLPIGNASTWLQCHIYAALGSIVVFLLHIQFRVPNGWFEGGLAIVFLVVSASGVYGLYLTRFIPRQLSKMTDEVMFERIPSQRHAIALQASRIALDCVRTTEATALADFYLNRLRTYFERSRGLAYVAVPSGRHRRRMLRELATVQQYCSETERTLSDRLFTLIRKRDDLDYQHALQFKLRAWLYVHIGLTYSLLICSLFHAVLAKAFHGGY